MAGDSEARERRQPGPPGPQFALPGRGGLRRIWNATGNSLRGIRHGAWSEAAIKQELAVVFLALPVSVFLARSVLEWTVLIGCLLVMLSAEFLNTAVERLCNHVTPTRHEAIRDIKDLASAGVFMVQFLSAVIWAAVALDRLGAFG